MTTPGQHGDDALDALEHNRDCEHAVRAADQAQASPLASQSGFPTGRRGEPIRVSKLFPRSVSFRLGLI
jgi:hypothetical protein